MISENNIFDVGAFDGLDGLILALKNPNTMVHAFEANPDLIKVIKANKNKIENYKKITLKIKTKKSKYWIKKTSKNKKN